MKKKHEHGVSWRAHKHMKRQVKLTVALVLLVLGVVYGGMFVARTLPGIISLVQPPPEDIAEVAQESELPLQLPDGFTVSVFAEGLGKPRVIAFDPQGTMLVSVPSRGEVVALPDEDGDGKADERVVVTNGLNNPHGIHVRCVLDELGVEELCELFVAEEDRLVAFNYHREALRASERRVVTDLPAGGGHTTRTLLPHPDGGRLLVSVGSSCNVCREGDERRAAILATDFRGGETEVFARGLRNAVFMALHPATKEVWVTEMGRDWLGDDVPPDEINIVREGAHYGWPYCYGASVQDVGFDSSERGRQVCERAEPSHLDIQAHSAPLGLAFVPDSPSAGGWPREWRRDLIVAYHGSWNRTEPTGYKLVRFDLDERGNLLGREDFVTGWLTEEGEVLGRPVDVSIRPGGAMYISDDRAGVVYRVEYAGSR